MGPNTGKISAACCICKMHSTDILVLPVLIRRILNKDEPTTASGLERHLALSSDVVDQHSNIY